MQQQKQFGHAEAKESELQPSHSSVFSFNHADAAASVATGASSGTMQSTFPATAGGSSVPASPGTPLSPAGVTHLRKLPFPNRLLHALPEYLNIPTSSQAYSPTPNNTNGATTSSHAVGSTNSSSQSSHSSRPPVHRWLRLPLAVLTHMTPASAFSDPLSDGVVGDADKASAKDDQSFVEKVQQERMKQEAQAAMEASHDLAQGQSTLLGNASGGGDSSTPAAVAAARSARRLSTPMLSTSVRSQRSMSLPHALPPLTLQHATLTTVLAAAQPSAKRKVTFSSLLHKLPHPSLKKLHRRTASFSHSEGESATATSEQHNSKPTTPSGTTTPTAQAAGSRSLLARVMYAPSHIVRSVLRRVAHAFREAVFMMHLAAILLSQLGLFGRWAFMAFRLFLFACVLCTAWAKIGYCVLMDVRTAKSLQYGPFNRNFLDIYLPTRVKGSLLTPHTQLPSSDDPAFKAKHPVFIYVTGGAWIIGYKAWGALLGLLMRSQQCVVVSVDYRNFPQGNIEDMVVDVEQALRWIWDNIGEYGGDRDKMFLAGQSAGAHITSIVLLRNAKREAEGMFDDELQAAASDDSAERIRQTAEVVEQAQEIVDIAREAVQLEDQQILQQDEVSDGAKSTQQDAGEKVAHSDTPLSDKSSNGTEMSKHRPPPLDPAVKSPVTTSSSSSSPTASPSPSPSPTPPSPTTLLAVSSALRTGFPVSRFRGYIGISGIYELSRRVIDHMHASGLPGGTVIAIMGGMEHINAVSPIRLIKQPEYSRPEVTKLFPPTLIIHGSADKSVPLNVAKEYGEALAAAGVKVRFRCYIGATHTDPIIEDPLRGCYHLTNDLANTIHRACSSESTGKDDDERSQHAAAVTAGGMAEDEEERQWETRMKAKYGPKISQMRRLQSLAFEVNGEQLVNAMSVNVGRRLNPF